MKHQTLPRFPVPWRKPPTDSVKPSPSSLFSPGAPSGSRDPSCFSSTMSRPQLRNLEQWDTSNSGSGWPRTLSIACLAPVWVPKWTFTATGSWEQAFRQNQRALHSLLWAGLRGHCWSPVLLIKAHPDSGRGNVMGRVSKNLQSLKTHGSPSSHTSPANSGGCTSFLKTLNDYFQWKCLLHCVVYMVYCILFWRGDQCYFFYCTFTTHIFYPFKDAEHSSVPEDSFTASPSQHLSQAHMQFWGEEHKPMSGTVELQGRHRSNFPRNCQFLT